MNARHDLPGNRRPAGRADSVGDVRGTEDHKVFLPPNRTLKGFPMTDVNALVARYLDTWNEPDAELRGKGVAQLWTEDGGYTDPLASVTGHQGVEAVITGARDMFKGHVFKLAGPVDSHHDIARFSWELIPEGGHESVVVGFDVAVLAEDGRIKHVYGFLDKVPA
jgi:hypothetical protein